MGALLSVRNDGPDEVELDVGRRVIVLRPGEDAHVNVTGSAKVLAPTPRETTRLFDTPRETFRTGED